MKSFIKYVLATITGIILTSLLLFFVMMATMSIMIASAEKQVTIGKNSVLVLNTGLQIPERGADDPFSSFDPIDMSFKPSAGINDIIGNLEKAAGDDRIKGVLIENGPMMNGWGKAEEIRMALERFRESGKFIISYTENYMSQQSYYVASVADKIYVNPAAIVEFKGISSEVTFYKPALEKLGVTVQVVRHGRYKGAVEKYMGSSLSPENRSQIERYISNIWTHVVTNIAATRGVTAERLNEVADGLLTMFKPATQLGLADSLLYRDQLTEIIKQKCGIEGEGKPKMVSMYKYSKTSSPAVHESEGKIALLYAEGTITMGRGSSSNIGSSWYTKTLRDIRESGDYKALVIRISSPGGNAIASDQIWREVKLTGEKMPVVISMSNYAASGGYYMAVPADKIVALPTSLTGSIGVFGLYPEAGDLLNKKLGITTETVMTNRFSDYPSISRKMDSQELSVMQGYVDKTYNEFVSRVSAGRDMDPKLVDSIGEGHVYSGRDALDIGLVDLLGGLNTACAEAASLTSISRYTIKEFPVVEDPYTRLIRTLTGDVKARIIEKTAGDLVTKVKDLQELQSMTGLQTRLPWIIHIN